MPHARVLLMKFRRSYSSTAVYLPKLFAFPNCANNNVVASPNDLFIQECHRMCLSVRERVPKHPVQNTVNRKRNLTGELLCWHGRMRST